MTNNNTTKTIHTFSYRYKEADSGTYKTSKLSVDLGLYNILKNNEEYLFSEVQQPHIVRGKHSSKTDWWLYNTTRDYREQNPELALTGCIREIAFCRVIDPSFLEGYQIDPDYIKIMCSKDDQSNTAVRLPTSLYHALKSMYDNDCDAVIQSQYTKIRSSVEDSDSNFSYRLRHKLLTLVIDPMVELPE